MKAYRTKKQAVVHAPKSAKAIAPYCQLDFRTTAEMKNQLALYMRPICPDQKIEIDTATNQILVNGEHRYNFELIDPKRPSLPSGVMF